MKTNKSFKLFFLVKKHEDAEAALRAVSYVLYLGRVLNLWSRDGDIDAFNFASSALRYFKTQNNETF